MARPDYGRSRWYGAHSNNYGSANRESSHNINKVIVHVVQGSWSSAINYFQDGRAYVSAHYTVRSSDGFIGQSVQEKDIAYHAGNYSYNTSSIGIEHEGYVSQPKWFTGAMYRSSARLTAYLCRKYDIPIDRNHIMGHNEVPGATHTDPGRYWDWPRYMSLVRNYANPRYKQIVHVSNNRFTASKAWGVSRYNPQAARGVYRYTRPRGVNDAAKFKLSIPSSRSYDVYARWPSDPGYNRSARFFVLTVNGWQKRIVNQRRNGGKWIKLGTFNMKAGTGDYIHLQRRSNSGGYIIAEAVMVKSA